MAFKTLKNRFMTYMDRHTLTITLTLLVFVFFVALFWHQIVISVGSGQAGVKWSRFSGTQLDRVYDEGLHILWPWDVMNLYSTRVQVLNNRLEILTSQGLTVGVDYTVRFYVIKNKVPVIHKTLGSDYPQTFVAPEVEAASMSVIGNYTPGQLYKIATLVIQSSIKYYLNKQLLSHNIVLDDYLIKRITLPKSISDSIEKKMVAEQLSLEFNFRLDIAEKEKKRKSIEAQGIKLFEEMAGIPILKWKGLEVTQAFATSKNAKIIIMGSRANELPLLFNADGVMNDADGQDK